MHHPLNNPPTLKPPSAATATICPVTQSYLIVCNPVDYNPHLLTAFQSFCNILCPHFYIRFLQGPMLDPIFHGWSHPFSPSPVAVTFIPFCLVFFPSISKSSSLHARALGAPGKSSMSCRNPGAVPVAVPIVILQQGK